jgi:hypothetical protein
MTKKQQRINWTIEERDRWLKDNCHITSCNFKLGAMLAIIGLSIVIVALIIALYSSQESNKKQDLNDIENELDTEFDNLIDYQVEYLNRNVYCINKTMSLTGEEFLREITKCRIRSTGTSYGMSLTDVKQ